MKRLLTHKGYEVYVRPAAGELSAHIERPGRRVVIPDIPAVFAEQGRNQGPEAPSHPFTIVYPDFEISPVP